MFESLGRLVYRGRWTLLVLSVAVAVLVAPFGLELFGRMADGGFEDPAAESTTSATWNDEWYSGNSPDVVVLYTHPTVPARDRRYRKAVHDSLRRLPATYVRRMTTYWTSRSATMISRDGRSTYALITLKGDKQRAYTAVEQRLRTVEGLSVKIGGAVPLLDDLNAQTGADLARAEAISMPVLLVLLVLVFGSLVAAGLPLLVGLLSVLGALVLLRLLTEVTDVSVFSLNVVTMLGLGLAIDYSLFVLSAFREEIRRGTSTEAAVVATMATAGRTVAFSGLTVATALLGLLLFPQMFLRSIGLGAAAVVLVAMVAALVVLPAVLGILGRKVDALRITPSFGGPRNGGAWHAVASSVMRTPLLYLVGVTAVLISLALPFVDVKFGNVDHRVLPPRAESRQVAEAVDTSFARNSMAAVDVHVLVERDFQEAEPLLPGPLGQGHTVVSPLTPVLPSDVKPFTDRLRRLPGVTGVDVTGFSPDNGAVRLAVRYDGDPMSDSARSLVTLIRSMTPEPNIRSVVVGGPTAAQMDLVDSLAATLPWMALVVCGATFVLLFAAFGSLLLPVKALLMNVLSIGASFGVIVWAFQYGNLAGLLGFTPTGTIEATVTVLILAVVFGLSMDYELFLLSRVRAEWLRTGDNAAAVAAGLQKTGGIITSAALLLLVVIGAFSTAGITIVKLLGVGMFVAIVVDATLVRALLVPATMRLMGAANWWLPGPLRGLHRRIELREHFPDEPPPTSGPRAATAGATASRALATDPRAAASRAPAAVPGSRRSRAAVPPAPTPRALATAPPILAVSPTPSSISASLGVSSNPTVSPTRTSPRPEVFPAPVPQGAGAALPVPPAPGSSGRSGSGVSGRPGPDSMPEVPRAEGASGRSGAEAGGRRSRRVVRPNIDGPGWHWADEEERPAGSRPGLSTSPAPGASAGAVPGGPVGAAPDSPGAGRGGPMPGSSGSTGMVSASSESAGLVSGSSGARSAGAVSGCSGGTAMGTSGGLMSGAPGGLGVGTLGGLVPGTPGGPGAEAPAVTALDTDPGLVLAPGPLFGTDTDPSPRPAPLFGIDTDPSPRSGPLFGIDTDPSPRPAVLPGADALQGKGVRRKRGINPYPGTTAPRRPRPQPGRHPRQDPPAAPPAAPPHDGAAEPDEPKIPEPRLTWVKVEPRTRVVRASPDGPGWSWQEVDG
ncbi:MMPL family transporter [Nonomuraea sp. NPDC003804]|uniref:MMPL family transporter n=1 Tax=Nonomuraea sp. NPDC003804 TaxID=3154547 RepID=UPI0033BE4C41